MNRIAQVFYDARYAGELRELDQGGFKFIYDSDYLISGTPLAYRLPLQKEPFVATELFSFFDNLVAEGWMREAQSVDEHLDDNDSFGLLLQNGKDLVGAVTVRALKS